ncbi:hypothetical protein NL676_028201 [Syzygium grande]|nr:hypothetical protein NL676_028201 [Syzygium grande]
MRMGSRRPPGLPAAEQAELKARQGIGILTLADVDAKHSETMRSVPRDGMTTGEIVLWGSSIMKVYCKDPKATSKAFRDGWFFTGDVGVVHPRRMEVESVLYRHPQVLEVAAVVTPHPWWGESPCAFVAVKKNSAGKTDDVKEAEIISYCRKNLAHFTVPKKVESMAELPKNHTGKILKSQLRAVAKSLVV